MDDVIERLRRLDPVPEPSPPPPLQALLRRLEQGREHAMPDPATPDAGGRGSCAGRSIGALVTVASVVIVIVIGVGAFVLLAHDDRPPHPAVPSTAQRVTPGRRQLIDMLGVLRRPQVATDIDRRLLAHIAQRDSQLEPLGPPDVPLMRRVVTSWRESLYLVAIKPSNVSALRAVWTRMAAPRPSLHRFIAAHDAETFGLFMSNGGGGASATAADIQYVGSDAFVGGRFAGLPANQVGYQYLIRVVPDGVTKVGFLVRSHQGRVKPGTPATVRPATVTATVRDNVAAARIRRAAPGGDFEAIWYDANGHVIKRSVWP